MLDVFTEGSDRTRLVAKGIRSKRSSLKGTLQSLTLLSLRFSGCGEVKTLRSAEAVSLILPPSGTTLYSGLHINELISCVFEYETRSSVSFFDYLNYIQALVSAMGSPKPALRRSELALLGHLGYGIDSTHCVDSGEPVDGIMVYRHREEKGLIVSVVINNITFTGRHLKALESQELPDVDAPHVAKRLIRMALEPYLGGKPLKSHELFRQFTSE